MVSSRSNCTKFMRKHFNKLDKLSRMKHISFAVSEQIDFNRDFESHELILNLTKMLFDVALTAQIDARRTCFAKSQRVTSKKVRSRMMLHPS